MGLKDLLNSRKREQEKKREQETTDRVTLSILGALGDSSSDIEQSKNEIRRKVNFYDKLIENKGNKAALLKILKEELEIPEIEITSPVSERFQNLQERTKEEIGAGKAMVSNYPEKKLGPINWTILKVLEELRFAKGAEIFKKEKETGIRTRAFEEGIQPFIEDFKTALEDLSPKIASNGLGRVSRTEEEQQTKEAKFLETLFNIAFFTEEFIDSKYKPRLFLANRDLLLNNFDYTATDHNDFQVNHIEKSTGKSNAIYELAKKLGIDPKNLKFLVDRYKIGGK